VYSELQSIWKDSGKMIDVKFQLLMTIVFLVLLCTAETWTVKKRMKRLQHLRWGVTHVFWKWSAKITELTNTYEQLYNEKKQSWIQSGRGSSKCMGIFVGCQTIDCKDIIVWNGPGWASSGKTCMKVDFWHFEVVWQRSERCGNNDRRQNRMETIHD